MWSRQLEKEDTTKAGRTPSNLLEYIHNQSLNEDFFPLLVKHHKRLKTLLNSNVENQEIKNALFIIELNKFSHDLEKIAEICAEIDLEKSSYYKNLEKIHEALLDYNSEELAREIYSLYAKARSYDKYFSGRHFLPKIDGRPLPPLLFLFSQPFSHNSKLSNEENILNLIASFRIHENFFKNYLNVLYSDGKEGEDFSGKSFEAISADYKKINEAVFAIEKLIPKSTPKEIFESIKPKNKALEEIIKKHPATLYLATKELLLYLENSVNKPLNQNPLPL